MARAAAEKDIPAISETNCTQFVTLNFGGSMRRAIRSLDQRISALEASVTAKAIVLHFSDGATKTLPGLDGLFLAVFGGANRTAIQEQQLALIRDAVYAEEPGGGHLIEFLQVILAAREAHATAQSERDAIG